MKRYWPYALFALLTGLVMAPLYGRGYVFLLDMVFTPVLRLPAVVGGAIPASYPLFAIAAFAARFIGSSAVQKIILSLILFLPAVFMYRLQQRFVPDGWAVLAGAFYSFNPWAYERWLSGQWLVLLGYAFFPLALAWFWDLLEGLRDGASWRSSGLWKFAALAAFYPIVDLHFAYIFAWFAALFFIVWAAIHRQSISHAMIRRCIKSLLIVAAAVLAVNSFWLVGVLHGRGAYAGITGEDFRAFVTQDDAQFGSWFNVLSLYGFWSNDYILPKDHFPLWWLVSLAFIGFAAFGAVRGFRKKQPVLIAVCIAFIPAWIFAVGYANGFSMAITQWAASVIPGFRGLRETEKFGGSLAFSFALLIAAGGRSLGKKAERVLLFLAGVLVFLSVYSMPFAFAGQVSASDYPASWYAADALMRRGRSAGTGGSTASSRGVIVFPWEAYLDLSFANFHQTANPTQAFFNVPVIASEDTGNPDITAPTGMWDKYAFSLVQGTATVDETLPFLAIRNIGYILLLKESDWQRYDFLNDSKGLVKVMDAPELTLYEVK